MKLSKYTHLSKYGNNIILYNLFNGALMQVNKDVDEPNYNKVLKAFNKEEKIDELDVPKDILNNFFVDDDTNEINLVLSDYLSRNYDPTRLMFIIVANNTCNFKCNYCYESHDERKITKETLDNLLNAIKRYHFNNYKLKTVGIEWYGGEPMLSFKEIIYFTKKLNEFCKQEGIEPVYAMTTNGFCLTPENAKKLFDLGIYSYQITIDGGQKTHDRLRPLKDGNGTWNTIMNNLTKLNAMDELFHVMIRVNYTYETMEDIDELIDYMAQNLDKNRFTIFFHAVSDWGGSSKDNDNVVDKKLIDYIACELIDKAVEKGVNITRLNSLCGRYGHICYASIPNHFVLSSDGNLRKCTFDMEKYDSFNKIGTINNGVLEIDKIKSADFDAPKFFYNPKCIECDILPICMNLSCPKTNLKSGIGSCGMSRKLISKIYEAKCRLYLDGNLNNVILKGLLD